MASRPARLPVTAAGGPARRQPFGRRPWGRLRRNPRAVLGAALLLVFGATALGGPALAPFPHDQPHIASRLHPPGFPYLLGTDHLGRDILSRILVAARVSLAIGLLSMIVSIAVGTAAGALAGFLGGWLDGLL